MANIKPVEEGYISWVHGQQETIDPGLLKETAIARGVNLVLRGGKVSTRPALTTLVELPYSGEVNGMIRYDRHSAEYLVVVIGGRILQINMSTLAIIDHGVQMQTTGQTYMCKAEKYMLFQDGTSAPVCLDGESFSTVAALGGSMPSGTLMAYGHGRVFLVPTVVPGTSEDGRRFLIAGDIVLPNDITNLLKFTETDYLNEGGAISAPEELGFIGAMSFLRNATTGTGFGPLIVLLRNGAAAFAVNMARSQWKNLDLGQVLFSGVGVGSVSPYALISVNGDLFYRSVDGIRTIKYSAGQLQSSATLACLPLSSDVTSTLLLDSETTMAKTYAAMADSKAYLLTAPLDDGGFRAAIVLDSAVINSFGESQGSCFYGFWPMDRAWAVVGASLDGSLQPVFLMGENGDYRLTIPGDGTEEGTVRSRLYTRRIYFNMAVELKQLQVIRATFSRVVGTTTITAYFRPMGFAKWIQLQTRTVVESEMGSPRPVEFMVSEDTAHPYDRSLLHTAVGFDVCLEITGTATLDAFRLTALPVPLETAPCPSETDHNGADVGVTLDDYEYGGWDDPS